MSSDVNDTVQSPDESDDVQHKRMKLVHSGSDISVPSPSPVDASSPASYKGRKKITRACDACKLRRTRCSGTLPCSRCSALSIECQFQTTYRRGQPPAPKSVAGSLLTPEFDRPGLSLYRSRSLSVQNGPQTSARQVPSARPSPERTATDFGGHYLGPSSGITFLNRAWRRLNQNFVADVPRHLQDEGPQSHTSIFNYGDAPFAEYHPKAFALPTREFASRLASIYFNQAVVTYRFLHKGSFESWLDEVYAAGRLLWEPNLKSQSLIAKAAVVFMVFAIVMLHEEKSVEWNTEVFDVAQSEHWFQAAQRMLSLQAGPPRLEMIQARLVQCLYLISSSRANQCMHTLGDVLYLILAAGLHRKKARHLSKISYIEHECQKRVFWSAYMLERYLCVMLGRPKTLHNEDIDQAYPDEINDEEMTFDGPVQGRKRTDCVHTASVCHFKLACIVGEMSREIYSILPISEERRLQASEKITLDLDTWKNELPPLFSSISSTSLINPFHRQSNILRTAHAHAVIHATRSFLLLNYSDLRLGSTPSLENVLRHVRKCVDAARTLVDMVNDLTDGKLSQAFWFTHYTSFCAVIVLYIYTIQQHQLFRQYTEMPKGPDILDAAERCQRSLADASRKHCPSQRYSIILEELRQEVHRQMNTPPPAQTFNQDRESIPGMDQAVNSVAPRSNLADAPYAYGRGQDDTTLTEEDDVITNGLIAGQSWNWNSTEWTQLDSLAYSQITDPTSLNFMYYEVPNRLQG